MRKYKAIYSFSGHWELPHGAATHVAVDKKLPKEGYEKRVDLSLVEFCRPDGRPVKIDPEEFEGWLTRIIERGEIKWLIRLDLKYKPFPPSPPLPPKPETAELYQHRYGYEKPVALGEWGWSVDFGRWGRTVTFQDGWHGFTWPKP